MFRTATTTAALAALALGSLAGEATASPNVDVSAHAEAHAVVESAHALRLARASADKAKAAVQRSEDSLGRAYHATVASGQQSSEQGLKASAEFGAAAQAQSAKLAALVRASHGSLRSAAAKALSQTGRWEAALVGRVADGLHQQQSSASAQQADQVATVGDDQASITATIVVTASGNGLRDRVRRALEGATAAAVAAQANLAKAVAELEQRSEGDGKQGMASAQSSLQEDGQRVADAIHRSGQADESATESTGDGPATASASAEAHVSVRGGRRR